MGNPQIAAGEPMTPATSPVADVDASAGHKRLVFCIVSLAIHMAAIDQTIVATGLPAIAEARVDVDIGIGVPGPRYYRPHYYAPHYYAPPPVYYPPPAYYAPAPQPYYGPSFGFSVHVH